MRTTKEVIEFLKTQTDSVVLFYSGGKDSIVLLDLLSKHFKVNLAFMYLVDGLEHVEKYLVWAKKKYNVEYKKYPHWVLSQMINDNQFRFHSNLEVDNITLGDVENLARKDFNCKWIVNGMKKADSMNRRLMLNTYFMQAINLKSHIAYPLSTWRKADCLNYIKQNKLPFPIAYNKKNSSGADLNYDFLSFCKSNYPEDYKKVIKQFPFAETILFDEQNK